MVSWKFERTLEKSRPWGVCAVLIGLLGACGGSEAGQGLDATGGGGARGGEGMGGAGGAADEDTDPTDAEGRGCRAPAREVDGQCRIPCDVLACDADQRTCIEASAEADAECGSCEDGYTENASGICVLTTCAANAAGSIKSSCDVLRRSCEGEDGSAECGACLPGYSAATDTETCKAQCQEDCACPTGFGWHPVEKDCFSCSGAALACDGAGETGNVWALEAQDGTACICETKPGYYTGSEGRTTFLCDADGDGWIVDSAQAAIESNSPVLRENARCPVRTIRRFVLRSESGRERAVGPDFEAMFPANVEKGLSAGLPLYESNRNDGQPSSGALPTYNSGASGRRFLPEEVTSLTRACVSSSTDVNHNGVADVEEWAESPVGPPVRDSSALRAYYAQYTAFSYFIELHDGWYSSPTAQRAYSTYFVRERDRGAGGAEGVAIGYPEGTSEYVNSCHRGVDVTYAGSPPNTIGGDFSRFGDEAGMFHHSQFKCIHVVSELAYAQAGYTEQSHPHMVARHVGGLERRGSGDAMHAVDFTVNDCVISSDGDVGRAPADPTNPVQPPIECQIAPAIENGTVRWAAVGFVPYSEPYRGTGERGDYARGCLGECVQEAPSAGSCDTCSLSEDGRGLLGTAPAGTACGEGGVCNGSGQCGGCVPGTTRCDGATLQTCDSGGTWLDATVCTFCATITPSVSAECRQCVPGERDCNGNVPRSCNSEGTWVAETSCGANRVCVGAGACLAVDGQSCSGDSACLSGKCSTFYVDADGDGYGSSTVARRCGDTPPAGTASVSGDCCDSDPQAYPGQTSAFGTPTACGGYDYDCDGEERRTYGTVAECLGSTGRLGWLRAMAACGQTEDYVTRWNFNYTPSCPSCAPTCYRPSWEGRQQTCR